MTRCPSASLQPPNAAPRPASLRGKLKRYKRSAGLVPYCIEVDSLSVGNRLYLREASRNQVDVRVRTNRRNHSTKQANSKELLTASRRHPGERESVGLHSTLEQDIRDYLADPGQVQRTVPGRQRSFQVVPTGIPCSYEAAALHRTGGTADGHYLKLADRMLRQGKYARGKADGWQILGSWTHGKAVVR